MPVLRRSGAAARLTRVRKDGRGAGVLRRTARTPVEALQQAAQGRWPRTEIAVKAAVSAVLAWQVAHWLPFAPAEEYPYYAPLGAVVAAYPNPASTARESMQGVLAIVAGAGLAIAVQLLPLPELAQLALVVAVGVFLAGVRLFGDMRSWVPVSALFVLVIGAGNPLDYVAAYAGLTGLGGLIAVGVALVLPTVPFAQSDRALAELARTLADQLEDLAEALETDDPPTSEQWRNRSQAIDPVRQSVNASSQDVEQSLRANARARRARTRVDLQRDEALVLVEAATRVEDLTALLIEVQSADVQHMALAERELRGPTAQALRSMAAAIRPLMETTEAHADDLDRARDDIRRLSRAVHQAHYATRRDRESAGAVVTSLRRCLGALEPRTEDEDALRPL